MTLVALRVPLSLSAAALATVCLVTFSRSYTEFPLVRPPHWSDVPVFAAIAAFLAISAAAAVAQAWRALRDPSHSRSTRALPPPAPFRHAGPLVVLCLGLVVFLEGFFNLTANT